MYKKEVRITGTVIFAGTQGGGDVVAGTFGTLYLRHRETDVKNLGVTAGDTVNIVPAKTVSEPFQLSTSLRVPKGVIASGTLPLSPLKLVHTFGYPRPAHFKSYGYYIFVDPTGGFAFIISGYQDIETKYALQPGHFWEREAPQTFEMSTVPDRREDISFFREWITQKAGPAE